MREFFASGVFSVIFVFSQWAEENKHRPEKSANKFGDMMSVETRKSVVEKLESYRETMIELGLSGVLATIDKIVLLIKANKATWGEYCELCDELNGRLIDEAKDKTFFHLSLRESKIYNNSRDGWESAIARFPGIIDDVEEAQKCFALSRYPASVFHSVQIVEGGLVDLGAFLKVRDPHSGWTAVSQALRKVIDKKHSDRTVFEKRNFKFLEQMQGTVEGLKNAWRNKISHTEGRLLLMTTDFSPEVAEEILFASRSFMRRLAEDLPTPKPAKKRKL
jgi:hypothetical protein